MRARVALLGFLAFAFAACGHLPTPGTRDTAYRNLTYASPAGKPLRLDLYVPRHVENPPLLIWIHGGGWRYGDKRLRFFLRDLTAEGFAVATVQYRLTWSAHWPAQRDDCLAAFEWLQRHGRTYGYDASRIGLGGDSAGGHLAALLGTLQGRPAVDAVAAFYPVTDCVKLGAHFRSNERNLLVRLFGGSYEDTLQAAADASPVNHVTSSSPPFLLIHGDRDKVVPLSQSESLRDHLRKSGVPVELLVIEGGGHGFSPDARQMQALTAFYRHWLQPAAPR